LVMMKRFSNPDVVRINHEVAIVSLSSVCFPFAL